MNIGAGKLGNRGKISLWSNLFIIASIICCVTGVAHGDGFYIDPQSAEGMSLAQAGAPSGHRDGSSAYYNPAALTLHSAPMVSMQGHWLGSSATFRSRDSNVNGAPSIGDSTVDGGREALIPMAYGVVPLSDEVVGGLYVNSPFGLGTKYSDDWIGRYQNIETLMRTAQFGASVGAKITEGLSLGGGISAMYADVKLRTAIDFGGIGAQALGAEAAQQLGLSPQKSDGYVDIESADWGLGWNAGLLYNFDDKGDDRLGISYRAATDIEFHGGSVLYTLPAGADPFTSSGAFKTTSPRSKITLPEMVSVGGRVSVSESIALLQQTTWTNWSRARSINIAFDNPAQPAISETLEWQDSWLYSLGVMGQVSENIELRVGGAYESGVVPSVSRRSPRMPTSEGVWTTVGVGLAVPDTKVTLDLSYARLQYLGGGARSSGPAGDSLIGDWQSYNQAFSLAANYTW